MISMIKYLFIYTYIHNILFYKEYRKNINEICNAICYKYIKVIYNFYINNMNKIYKNYKKDIIKSYI